MSKVKKQKPNNKNYWAGIALNDVIFQQKNNIYNEYDITEEQITALQTAAKEYIAKVDIILHPTNK